MSEYYNNKKRKKTLKNLLTPQHNHVIIRVQKEKGADQMARVQKYNMEKITRKEAMEKGKIFLKAWEEFQTQRKIQEVLARLR